MRLALALLLLVTSALRAATTYTATSTSRTHCAAVLDSSINTALADGDTVNIPAGTSPWASTINVTKNISIIGAGIGQTIIVDEIPRAGGNIALLHLGMNSGTAFLRLSGITFKSSADPTYQNQDTGSDSTVRVSGVSSIANFRMDHCHFDDLYAYNFLAIGGVIGVIDNCTFSKTTAHASSAIQVEHGSWKGVGAFGDNSWADDTNFGTDQALYIETCSFTDFNGQVCDGASGCRVVFRNNTVTRGGIGNHGTDTGQRNRGGRKYEVYNNTFITTAPGGGSAIESRQSLLMRSGAALVHHNTVTNYDSVVLIPNYRFFDGNTPFGYPDGTNVWDQNYASALATGTHTGSNGASTLTDSGANFTSSLSNAHGGALVIRNVTQGWGTGINTIDSATSLTRFGSSFFAHTWQTGDSYQARVVLIALDQAGRGKSDLISGGSSSVAPTPTTWPNQALEPVRVWSNTWTDRSNGYAAVHVDSGPTALNVDYYYSSNATAELPGYAPYTYPHPLTGEASPVMGTRKVRSSKSGRASGL